MNVPRPPCFLPPTACLLTSRLCDAAKDAKDRAACKYGRLLNGAFETGPGDTPHERGKRTKDHEDGRYTVGAFDAVSTALDRLTSAHRQPAVAAMVGAARNPCTASWAVHRFPLFGQMKHGDVLKPTTGRGGPKDS